MQQQVQTLTLKVESVREAAANAASAKKAADLSIARERFQKNVKAALKEKYVVFEKLMSMTF